MVMMNSCYLIDDIDSLDFSDARNVDCFNLF